MKRKELRYIDRQTGETCVEKIYGLSALELLYGEKAFFARLLLPLFTYFSFFSVLYGWLQKWTLSKKKVVPFIQEYGVDPSEFQESVDSFQSFNDFFIRKLRAEVRPIVKGASILSMPADGRYLVFPKLADADGFYVKGKKFQLADFLQDLVLARRFSDGAMMIARLCPTDYHRFHFPCDGVPSRPKRIQGHFFSVNPLALAKRGSILWENKRFLTEIESKVFGTILYVEVGATCVGSVKQTYVPHTACRKGEEKGYFEFGGSCLVLLFEKGRVLFDEDLVRASSQGLETKACFGQSFGKCV